MKKKTLPIKPLPAFRTFGGAKYVLYGVYKTKNEAIRNAKGIITTKTRIIKIERAFKYGSTIKKPIQYAVYYIY